MWGRLKHSELLRNLDKVLDHLTEYQKKELTDLILYFPSLFSDMPSHTHLVVHDIEVGKAEPIRQRFYQVSQDKHA